MSISSNLYIPLYGSFTPAEMKTAIGKIKTTTGRAVWQKALASNPNLITNHDVAIVLNDPTSTLPFYFDVSGGAYNILVRCLPPSLSSGSASLDGAEAIVWSAAPGYISYEQVVPLFTSAQLGAGMHLVTLSYREPMGIISLIVQDAGGIAPEMVMTAVNTFLYPTKKYILPRSSGPDFVFPALNSSLYGTTAAPVIQTGTPKPDLSCKEESTPLPSEPYLLMYGNSTKDQKLEIVRQISTYCGRTQWENQINTNEMSVSGQEVAVILNTPGANLLFRFGVVAGAYNIILRCVMPSANADSGFVSLDGMPEQMFSPGLGPTKYINKQLSIFLFEKIMLEGGYHELMFSYREPMGYIDVIINRTDFKSADLIMPAIGAVINPDVIYGEQEYVATITPKVYYTTTAPPLVKEETTLPNVIYTYAPMETVYPMTTMIPMTTTMAPVVSYVTTTAAPLFSATGAYSVYTKEGFSKDAYTIIVYTGNGTIKFKENLNVLVLAVAGGGGGSGGMTQQVQQGLLRITGGSGGNGGSHIYGLLSANATTNYAFTVGQGGSAGGASASGGNGGDTIISGNNVEFVRCVGGSGGSFNSTNSPASIVSSQQLTVIQTGTGGMGGNKGFIDQRGGKGTATVGGDSSTFYAKLKLPFTTSYVADSYSGGGGGGGGSAGGMAAMNGKGGGAENFTTGAGQAATTYGSGGGGAGSSGIGGKGANGVVVLYFANTGYSLPSVESLKPATTLPPVVPKTTIPPYRITMSCKGKSGKEQITISTNKGTLETITLPKTSLEKNYYFSERPVFVSIYYGADVDGDVFITKLEMNATNLLPTYYNLNATKQTEVRKGNLLWGLETYQFDVPSLTKNTLIVTCSGRTGTENLTITTNRGIWKTFKVPKTPTTTSDTMTEDFALTTIELYFTKPSDNFYVQNNQLYIQKLEYNGKNLLPLYTNANTTVQNDVRNGKLLTPGTSYIFKTVV